MMSDVRMQRPQVVSSQRHGNSGDIKWNALCRFCARRMGRLLIRLISTAGLGRKVSQPEHCLL